MKIIRILAALAISVFLFYIASSNSKGRPELRTHSENGYDFQFNTVPKIVEFLSDSVLINVEGDLEGKTIVLRHTQPGATVDSPLDAYAAQTLTPDPITPNKFRGDLTAGKKLKRVYYFFEVVDTAGVVVATFTNTDTGTPFWLRGIGHVAPLVIGSHILLIFATVFFILMAAMQAFQMIGGGGNVRAFGLHILAATVLCFIGGYPLGFAMNWYAFGTTWEGVPFGTDATDNKTQILFLYLVFMTLATLKSATGCKCLRDFFSRKALGWFGLGAFALMILIYFIPHSAQYDPTLTYAVCYSWAALMALLVVIGFVRSKGAETT